MPDRPSPLSRGTSDEACPRCQGDGIVPINPAWPDPQGEYDVRCPACNGTGLVHQPAHRAALDDATPKAA